jgi:N-acetylglutamate synthase-like GNAT family acetyltransferase
VAVGKDSGVPDVRRATTEDVDVLAHVLARAFDDDPVSEFLFPDTRRRQRALPRYFSILLRTAFLPTGEVWTDAGTRGGAMWTPPSQRRPSMRDLLRFAPLVPVLGRRLPAAISTMQAVERHHPRTPHWYLAVLGTDPPRQRCGVGSSLLEPVLARCDTEGLPAYLESSKERNVPFYARHGFEVTKTIELPGGGPPLWLMWREPRS